MDITEVLSAERTRCDAPGISKKRVLEFIADYLSEHTDFITAKDLYGQLLAREKLGSTGIGEGVALPHCRLAGCPEITGLLLKLESPVDFDSIDSQAVDLVFALIVPDEQNDEHLKTLANIAALLQSPGMRDKLRHCTSDSALYQTAVTQH